MRTTPMLCGLFVMCCVMLIAGTLLLTSPVHDSRALAAAERWEEVANKWEAIAKENAKIARHSVSVAEDAIAELKACKAR